MTERIKNHTHSSVCTGDCELCQRITRMKVADFVPHTPVRPRFPARTPLGDLDNLLDCVADWWRRKIGPHKSS